MSSPLPWHLGHLSCNCGAGRLHPPAFTLYSIALPTFGLRVLGPCRQPSVPMCRPYTLLGLWCHVCTSGVLPGFWVVGRLTHVSVPSGRLLGWASSAMLGRALSLLSSVLADLLVVILCGKTTLYSNVALGAVFRDFPITPFP